jgi:hypothetical protein
LSGRFCTAVRDPCGDRALAAKPVVGGGLGSTLRYIVNAVCPRFLGTAFPHRTFIINITGSTVMGLIAGPHGVLRHLGLCRASVWRWRSESPGAAVDTRYVII